MTSERYTVWYAWEGRELDVVRFLSEAGEAVVEVDVLPSKQRWTVRFEYAIAARLADEGNRIRTVGSAEWERGLGIYLVAGSEFLRWLHADSRNVHADADVKHYAIVSSSGLWVDVASIVHPSVEPLISNNEHEQEQPDREQRPDRG